MQSTLRFVQRSLEVRQKPGVAGQTVLNADSSVIRELSLAQNRRLSQRGTDNQPKNESAWHANGDGFPHVFSCFHLMRGLHALQEQ